MFDFKRGRVLLFGALTFLILGCFSQAFAVEITLDDLNGQKHSLSHYRGKPVILFFWTTWCPSCRKELVSLGQRSVAISEEGIVVLGVDAGEPDYKVKKYLKGLPVNFTILLDKKMELVDKYELIGVPTFVLLNKDGKMVAQAHRFPANYKSLLAK
jgi:peroxiredoxin